MVHDPVSLLKPEKFYIDSAKIEVPRKTGIINSDEIHKRYGGYPIERGNIIFNKDTLKVIFFLKDYDRGRIYESTWNGEYLIHWRGIEASD